MNLSFSTKWPERMGELAGQPNYFVEKFWEGLITRPGEYEDGFPYELGYERFSQKYYNKSGKYFDGDEYQEKTGEYLEVTPKLHVIQYDPHHLWKPGMKIHPIINNGTKNRFQFAPTLICTGVQEIEIKYDNPDNFFSEIWDGGYRERKIKIDGEILNWKEEEQLAINDGFPSMKAFFDWFNEDFEGVIVHWTELKY